MVQQVDELHNASGSPSPLGDGVQSAASERAAAGLDKTQNQPGQQRVNAAERRERGENVVEGDKAGERSSLVQSPGEVEPGFDNSVELAAAAHKERETVKKLEEGDDLPAATRDEMNAGRKALDRSKANHESNASHRMSNPVDDLAYRQKMEADQNRERADRDYSNRDN